MQIPLWQVEDSLTRIQVGSSLETGVYIVRDAETGGRPDLYHDLHRKYLPGQPLVCTKPKELNHTGYKAVTDHVGSKAALILVEATRRRFHFTPQMLFSIVQNRLLAKNPRTDWARFLPVLVVNMDWVYEGLPDRHDIAREEANERKVLRLETTDAHFESDLKALFGMTKNGVVAPPLHMPA